MNPLRDWFKANGWRVAAFQKEAWDAFAKGRDGLILSPTGSGKTLAAIGGPLLKALTDRHRKGSALRVLWITPLRALAADTAQALRKPVGALLPEWEVVTRTGDSGARERRVTRQGKAAVVIITPESLALQISYPEARDIFANLDAIIVDEWHELLDSKRGALLQLTLNRVRSYAPGARCWGLSASVGNPHEAAQVLFPAANEPLLIGLGAPRDLKLKTLLPQRGHRFPWAGHLGLAQLQQVHRALDGARTSILFTNTRSQAELWHRALSSIWMDDPATLVLHHGSLSMELRHEVEEGIRSGTVRCVVATSSLDLGVDFPSVDQVFQVGSPKGLSRLLQRGGRARHRPGEKGIVHCVPTHAMELAEFAAAREALKRGDIESRTPPVLPLDVLAQHCVTIAVAEGFAADELYDEVIRTHAFRNLTHEQFRKVLNFIVRGGEALEHYPEYRRVLPDEQGAYRITDRKMANRHRLSIGTITAYGAMQVRFAKGGHLGSIEEQFIVKLRPRDVFHFAGKTLELVQVRDMTAFVRVARKRVDGTVPRWEGGKMPMSTRLAKWVERALSGELPAAPELHALQPLLSLQNEVSATPQPGTTLAEWIRTREGPQLFLYPFSGRSAHEGLASLLALRWGRHEPNTITFAVNDYGLALRGSPHSQMDASLLRRMLSPEHFLHDLAESVNLTEMARRQFREIARVAGLVFNLPPGRAPRTLRQLQASSGLLFDVLQRYDPQHILLAQARQEVLEVQLGLGALREALTRCKNTTIDWQEPPRLTPLSFPLWAEMTRGSLSTESWKTRVERAAAQLERHYA